MYGTLTVAATPIGNPDDATTRLRTALSGSALIAAEDTRRVRRLADSLDIRLTGRVVSLFEGNEAQRTEALLEQLVAGHDVLLVSDAGTPTISDPGTRLVRRAPSKGSG